MYWAIKMYDYITWNYQSALKGISIAQFDYVMVDLCLLTPLNSQLKGPDHLPRTPFGRGVPKKTQGPCVRAYLQQQPFLFPHEPQGRSGEWLELEGVPWYSWLQCRPHVFVESPHSFLLLPEKQIFKKWRRWSHNFFVLWKTKTRDAPVLGQT